MSSDTEQIEKASAFLRDTLSGLGRWPQLLVVDDDENDLGSVMRELTKFQCVLTATVDPIVGSEIIASVHFDVVFMDVVMPRVNGDEIIAKALGMLTNTNFVVVTGSTHPDSPVVSRALKAGARLWFTKPLTEAKLATILKPRATNLSPL